MPNMLPAAGCTIPALPPAAPTGAPLRPSLVRLSPSSSLVAFSCSSCAAMPAC